jgi:uncharacterized protein involved in outer membrane biogenesis
MLKILFIIAINFVVLFAIGLFALNFFVKTDKIKTEITSRISSLTGQQFVINGKIHFSFYPVFGVAFQDAVLENPAGFDQSMPMIQVKEGDVGMSLSSLLKGDVVIKKIIFNQPVIRIVQNKNNAWNVSFRPQKKSSPEKATPSKSADKKQPAGRTFTIPDILVEDGDVIVQPLKGGKTEISNIELLFDHGEIHTELPFTASFMIDQQNLKGTVAIKGQFFEESNDRFDIRLLEIDTDLMSGQTPIKSHMTTDVIIDSNQIKTEMFGMVVNGSTLTGEIIVSNYKAGINELTVSGEIALDKINVPLMNISNLSAKIQGKNGVVQLLPLSAIVAGGQLNGSAGIDFTKKTSRVFLKASVNQINIQSVKGLDKLSGRGNLSVNLSANAFDHIVHTLNGNLALNIPAGKMMGFDLSAIIRTGLAVASINPTLLLPSRGYTDFKNAKATATIQGGVLSNRDFVMETTEANVKGSGSIDFAAGKINYELEATPRGINNVMVPITITGNLSDPDVGVNKPEILAEIVRGILMSPVDKTKKTIELPADLLKKILH